MAEIIPMTEEQKFQLRTEIPVRDLQTGHEPERSRRRSISVHWH